MIIPVKWVLTTAVLLGCSVFPLAQWYVNSLRPSPPVITNVVVHERDKAGGVLMEVTFASVVARGCVRLSFHQLSRPPTDPEQGFRRYILLGGAIAGPDYALFTTRNFTVAFHLPESIIAGVYSYTFRIFYQCGVYKLVPFSEELVTTVTIPPKRMTMMKEP